MQQSSLIKFISAGILVAGVTVIPMTLPAAAQVASPSTQQRETTDETRNDNNAGLWGLSGLLGLLGLVGRRKENTDREMRENTPTYNDPSRR